MERTGPVRDLASASGREDFHAVAERHSRGRADSIATEGFDYREAEEVYCRPARDRGRDRDEQPAHFRFGRSSAHRAHDLAAEYDHVAGAIAGRLYTVRQC